MHSDGRRFKRLQQVVAAAPAEPASTRQGSAGCPPQGQVVDLEAVLRRWPPTTKRWRVYDTDLDTAYWQDLVKKDILSSQHLHVCNGGGEGKSDVLLRGEVVFRLDKRKLQMALEDRPTAILTHLLKPVRKRCTTKRRECDSFCRILLLEKWRL